MSLSQFSDSEKKAMLFLKGVGTTVIARLEQVGFSQLSQLKEAQASDLTKQIADMMGSSCWHNSPMARNSIQSIIDLAKKIGGSHLEISFYFSDRLT